MNESEVSRKLKDTLRINGAWCIKLCDRVHSNYPDLVGTYHGALFAIETKIYPNKPTEGQKFELKAISASGGMTVVAIYNKVSKLMRLMNFTTGELSPELPIKDAAIWLLKVISSSIKSKQ